MKRLFIGAALLAAACGNTPNEPEGPVDPEEPTDPDDPPQPEEVGRDYDELASILAAHVRAEFALQLLSVEITEGRTPQGFTLTNVTATDYSGVGTAGGLNLQFVYHCNDGSTAHTIVPCDGLAHHSHIKYTIDGAQAIDNMAMDGIQRVVDWEVRDITIDKARFRGPDQVVLNTSVAGATYKVQFHAVYEQVRFLAGYAYPTFGTIDFDVNTERQREADRRVFDAKAQIVYGSSGTPTTLTFDGTRQYKIDVVTGAVTKL